MVHGELFGKLGIEHGLATCKASTLPSVLSLWSLTITMDKFEVAIKSILCHFKTKGEGVFRWFISLGFHFPFAHTYLLCERTGLSFWLPVAVNRTRPGVTALDNG